jgi:hypothetical protein
MLRDALMIMVGLPVSAVFALAFAGIYTHHRRKMEELRLKEQRLISADIQAEFEKIRGELRELRDVTMQYDLSFDTALQQMEHRIAHIERPQYGQQHNLSATESILRGGHN